MLDPATRRRLLPTLALALTPLLLQLPPALAAAIALGAIGIALLSCRVKPSGLLKLVLTLAVAGAVFIAFDFRMGRDTGCALLAAMLALKPAETHRLRDARSLVAFALFAPFATFLLDQGPLSLALGLAATVAALANLQWLADVEAGIAPQRARASLHGIGKLVALGLPLTLAAFWLFPRIATPLWGVPERANAKIGLSDSISPGDWLDLMSDDSPALRVRFQGASPPTSQMYWRGPVLWDFDGRTWKGSRPPGRAPAPVPAIVPANAGWRYTLEVEPSERRYLTALDLPMAAAEGSFRSPDGDLLSAQPLQALTRWSLHSAPVARFQPRLGATERHRALRFPRQSNPRAQHLARRWRDETGGDPAAIVRKAMTMVNADFAYSLAAPPLGRDSVDEFLFRTRTGYCEHFSSSFVFLMRAAGVPARVVTGYAGGYRNPMGDYWIVRNSDAHAWAEVWLAERGWVRIDPTAAVAPERIYDTVDDRLPGNFGGGLVKFNQIWNLADYLRSGWNDFVLGFNAERQARMFGLLGIDRVKPGQLVFLFALCTALAVGWMLWWLNRGEREPDALLRAWHALSRRYRRFGLSREVSESAGDWAARIATARPRDAETIRALAKRFNEARYAGLGERRQLERDLLAFRPRD
ncbi:DUF3488 domain-containing protein [Lysobacter pythonis]|uniref:DUF3488 domain-containing protein n=1 Tax=Solilutibacter pythonis TaxID=2483112 RepID=A0A3M2HVA3_9GAMM|nr:DUF3488 and transglutaminase-like domain-containing protein [Lysobacter pythonis]RMH90852.1 DUF3488 domain-containing protein [Lysobacter pythonis]